LRVPVHRGIGHYLGEARRYDGVGFDNYREPATNPEAGKIDRFPR
jgi:hypothetical protein